MTKILVIEDDAILREEVVEWLTLEGYEAVSANDGLAGLELAFRRLPDLIVSDITMPGMDGYRVLLELYSNPMTNSIPFIFVTARAAQEDIRYGMKLGADDYITKPFTRLELLQSIQARLEKKAAQTENNRQQIEQLERALAEEHEQRLLKAKMVAMFSHDFRGSLSAILWSNSILRNYGHQIDDERRLATINRIEVSAQQLMQMLDDLLIISQIENGSLDFKPEPMSLGKFLEKIVEDFQVIHGETHQILFEDQLMKNIRGDPRLLRQIAVNLISNAVKYSPSGSTIQIRVENTGDWGTLVVRDQGIGISEADQKRLFEAFQRGSNVGDVLGTGLGLAIVKQATDLHGGTIQLESEFGKGTTALVTIPIY